MEVTVFLPPFIVTSIITLLLFIITRERMGWRVRDASLLAVGVSSLLGAFSYILMAALLGCPPCS